MDVTRKTVTSGVHGQGAPSSWTHAVHADANDDAELLGTLVPLLAGRAGRVLFGGVPTGVAVAWATQHGGPYPATTAPGTTSVGMTAARRFLRPVCFQDAPPAVLPPALRDENPLNLWRRVDGELTRAGLPSAPVIS